MAIFIPARERLRTGQILGAELRGPGKPLLALGKVVDAHIPQGFAPEFDLVLDIRAGGSLIAGGV